MNLSYNYLKSFSPVQDKQGERLEPGEEHCVQAAGQAPGLGSEGPAGGHGEEVWRDHEAGGRPGEREKEPGDRQRGEAGSGHADHRTGHPASKIFRLVNC